MDIRRSDIEAIDEILSRINDPESDMDIYKSNLLSFTPKLSVDVLNLLLTSLEKVNKKNLRKAYKCVNGEETNTKPTAPINEYHFSEDETLEIFYNHSKDEIEREYSLSSLRAMYESIYDRKPSSNKTKSAIISTVKNFIYTVERAKAFKF